MIADRHVQIHDDMKKKFGRIIVLDAMKYKVGRNDEFLGRMLLFFVNLHFFNSSCLHVISFFLLILIYLG